MRVSGCPLHNLIPEWNDLIYQRQLGPGLRPAAHHQQLPGVHRPGLPRPVRGGLHLRPPRRPGDHATTTSWPSLSTPLSSGLIQPRMPRRCAPERRWRWWAPAPRGLRRPTSSTSRGHTVTVYERERPAGRPADVRHPQHEAGKVGRRPPREDLMQDEGVEFVIERRCGRQRQC